MSRRDFYKNSFVLTLSNLATGVLGFIFSVYLSKLLGDEGIGLYGLIMPIYNLFISIMTAGLIAAISKVTAVYSAEDDYMNIVKTMRIVGSFNFLWCLFIGVFVFFLSPIIGNLWIKDPRTVKAIMVTCPAMVFISLSNILKGFFYGTSKITVPSIIDILEKSLRIFILSLLVFMFRAKTLECLVTLAYVSLCLGELQSLLLLFGYFKIVIKKAPMLPKKREGRAQLLFDVLTTSFPLCLNGFLMSILGTLSTLIVPRRLMIAGFTYSQALGLIGRYSGMALSIVTFPIIIIASINTVLIPDLSQTINKKDYYSASKRIKEVLKIAILIGICTAVIGQCIPNDLGRIFFGRDDLGNFIKVSSLMMPIVFTSNTMYGILNGLNKQSVILRNTLITEILEITLLFIFTAIPSINIYGYAITMLLISTLSLCLNLYEVYKTINLEISLANIIIYILTGVLCYIFFNMLSLKLTVINYKLKVILISGSVILVFVSVILGNRIKYIFKKNIKNI